MIGTDADWMACSAAGCPQSLGDTVFRSGVSEPPEVSIPVVAAKEGTSSRRAFDRDCAGTSGIVLSN